jgi:hypothetical protein
MKKAPPTLDGFHLVAKERRRVGKLMAVSLNSKVGRIVFYQLAYQELKDRYGQLVEYVQLFTHNERPKSFWIKPCESTDPAARFLNKLGRTPYVSAKFLSEELNWSSPKTVQYPAVWDSEVGMLRVDLASPL